MGMDTEVVLYSGDLTLHGSWSRIADSGSAGRQKIITSRRSTRAPTRRTGSGCGSGNRRLEIRRIGVDPILGRVRRRHSGVPDRLDRRVARQPRALLQLRRYRLGLAEQCHLARRHWRGPIFDCRPSHDPCIRCARTRATGPDNPQPRHLSQRPSGSLANDTTIVPRP
jgi:hypothetical protein